MAVGIPVSLLFMAIVIGAQAGMQKVNWEMARDENGNKKEVPAHWKYLPAVINTVLIILFGKIYKWISTKLVLAENHRYESEFENSTANKTYMFNFINTYISNFVVVCYNQNFFALTKNLFIVMLGKQVILNVYDWAKEKWQVGGAIKESDALFVDKLAEAKINEDKLQVANLEMHEMINR